MSCLSPCVAAPPKLGFLQAGEGETVVLLHGSAGTSTLWRKAIAVLQPLYRVVAPDLIGYGKSAPWPARESFSLAAERHALAPLMPCCGAKYHLVGYSYGGVVALDLALSNPVRVRTLTLIEPVFFSALRHAGRFESYDQFCRVHDRFRTELARGNREMAVSGFLDFWTGPGSWQALPLPVRADMLRAADKLLLDWEASFAFDPEPERLAALATRTALVCGDASPEPMRALVDGLHALMPGSAQATVPGANHLLPLTHAAQLIDIIAMQLHADAERSLR